MSNNWIPLLIPEMPSLKEITPFLEELESSNIYSNFGPLVNRLEENLAKKFCVDKQSVTTVANATLGLELVLKSLNLRNRAKILLPAFTFVATATAVVRAGYTPIFADVDLGSWNLTREIAEEAIKEHDIQAIVTVAALGLPQDMQAWKDFEFKHDIPVIVDAAAAYGSQALCEGWGTLIFSLHATKNLSAGEGGVVISNKKNIIKSVRNLSNFGLNIVPNNGRPYGALLDIGTNAKMSEYHAAVALASINKWDEVAFKRRKLSLEYSEQIKKIGGDEVFFQDGGVLKNNAPVQFCIRFGSQRARHEFEEVCRMRKIMLRRWYQPLVSHMSIFDEKYLVGKVVNSITLSEKMVGIPFFPSISCQQKNSIFNAVKEVFKQ